MRRWLLWAPLAAFAILFVVVAAGLFDPADRTVRSGLIGQTVPEFRLDAIVPGKPGLSSAALRSGEPRLINVFASWCVPCIAEAPQLLELKRRGVRIDGVAVRDGAPALQAFLRRNGDPFDRIGNDRTSSVQLSLGSAGIPESFVVDGRGVIRHQHVGMIQPDDVPALLAAVEKAQ